MVIPNLKKGKLIKIVFFALLVGLSCPLVMWGQSLGDVNSSGSVDIIDALLISQYYVGLNPSGFDTTVADVNCSGGIDIIDALLVAQYYVGLIPELSCGDDTPVPTDDPNTTPDPTDEPVEDTQIQLNGNSITVTGAGATVDGTNVTITSGGTYTVSGTLNDGRIIVETDDEILVTVNLNGINIYSSVNAPISVMNAPEGAEFVLVENTVNYVTDSSSYVFEDDDDEPNAAFFAKDDMDITGEGTLIVDANYNDGIACKDDMNIKDCTISVNAVDDGIRGKNSLEIKSGTTITINCAGDCLKSDDDEDGLIEIKSCTLDLTSTGGDGMDAAIEVTVTNDESIVNLTTGGGSNSMPNDEISTKGIKGSQSVLIEDGILNIDSSDDTIHSNDTITISGGTMNLASGDDTIHADLNLPISRGTINITKSYEGIESEIITISGGDIHIVSSDDALNASEAGDVETEPGQMPTIGEFYVYINGGYIYANAAGDGIDSNGYIVMTNGTALVDGPVEQMNGAVDYELDCTISGGLLVAAGSSGMPMTGAQSSTQNCLLVVFDTQYQAGNLVNIQSSNGASILTFSPAKTYQSLAFSSPDLAMGTTYNIYTGGNASGTIVDGLLQDGGTYNPGTLYTSFTVSSNVTTIGDVMIPF